MTDLPTLGRTASFAVVAIDESGRIAGTRRLAGDPKQFWTVLRAVLWTPRSGA